MVYENGTTVDGRFEIKGLCSNTGGMGQILFVKDLRQEQTDRLVLKYCKEDNPNLIDRFRREIRLMQNFHDNSKIVDVLYANTKATPPYFIMPYYKNGDLSKIVSNLKDNYELQESILCSMIDCIQELHNRGIYHRDIKPQNFLLDDNNKVLVSDFGLGVEIDSNTRNTTTRTFGGTEGYIPPEFRNGGFKYADARGDIYMLGKSFYALLTDQNPTHIEKTKLHPALYLIIEKACDLNKDRRYQDLMELKQIVVMSYDIILGRSKNKYSETKQLLKDIVENKEIEKMENFIQNLPLLKEEEQISICKEFTESFFIILIQKCTPEYLEKFLKIYQIMIETADYPFSFAEVITKNMLIIFSSDKTDNELKSLSLSIAIKSAYLTNRYVAMDICTSMICSVTNDTLGAYVSAALINNDHTFIQDINLSDCKCDSIINTISVLKENEEIAKKEKMNKQNEFNSIWGL